MDTNLAELIYAKNAIPYLFNASKETRDHLWDVFGHTDCVGLKQPGNQYVLWHNGVQWWMTKDAAIKWAEEVGLKVVNKETFV